MKGPETRVFFLSTKGLVDQGHMASRRLAASDRTEGNPLQPARTRSHRLRRRTGSRRYVVRVDGRQKTFASDGEGDPRRINRDPAATELLTDVAVVPEPHVGSITRSPGSVVISTQRVITLVLV